METPVPWRTSLTLSDFEVAVSIIPTVWRLCGDGVETVWRSSNIRPLACLISSPGNNEEQHRLARSRLGIPSTSGTRFLTDSVSTTMIDSNGSILAEPLRLNDNALKATATEPSKPVTSAVKDLLNSPVEFDALPQGGHSPFAAEGLVLVVALLTLAFP